MMMNRSIAAISLAAVLAGCTSLNPSAQVTNDIAANELALTAAEQLALTYTRLPRCVQGGSPICSNQATVDKIKNLDNQAYAAVQLAKSNSGFISAAIEAVSAFRNAIPTSTGG